MEAGGVNKNLRDVYRHIKYLKFFKAQVTLNGVYRHSRFKICTVSIHTQNTVRRYHLLFIGTGNQRFSVSLSTDIKGYIGVKLRLKRKQRSMLHSFIQKYTCILDQKVYSSCGIWAFALCLYS